MGTLLRGVRNVLRSPIRLVLVVAILGTSLMFVAAMFALNASAQQRLTVARDSIGTGIDVRVAGSFGPFGGTGTITAAQVKTISATAGIVSLSEALSQQYAGTAIKGNITAPTGTGSGNGGGGFAGGGRFNDDGTIAPSIYGLTPGQSSYTLTTSSVAKVTSGRDLKTSEATANVALMSSSLASANGLKVGSTFTLESTTFTLVGLFTTGSTFSDDTIIIPLQTAQTIYKITGVSSVIAYAASDSTVDAVVTRLKSALGSGVDVTSQASLNAPTLTALKDAQGNMFTTLVVSIITAALVILFAVMLIVRERVQEIALLKAIGASHWQVISQFGVEVLSLSGIAAVVALLLLALVGGTLASKFNVSTATGGFSGGRFAGFGGGAATTQTPFSAGLTFGSLLVVLALGVLLAVIASVIPAWYVARIKPADVLRAD